MWCLRKRAGTALQEVWETIAGELLLDVAGQSSGPVYLVTSVGPAEGKTTVARELARTLAESGTRTALVTVDTSSRGALRVVPLAAADEGSTAASPSEFRLEGSALRAARNLPDPHDWSSGAAVSLIDADTLDAFLTRLLVPKVDGVILVVRVDRTGIETVLEARQRIRLLKGRLLGVVMNRFTSAIPERVEHWILNG